MTSHQLVVMGAGCSRLIRELMEVRGGVGCRKQEGRQGWVLLFEGHEQ